MTLTYRVAALLRRTAHSPYSIAPILGVTPELAENAFRALRRRGFLRRVGRSGKQVLYRLAPRAKVEPDGRGRQPGSRAALIPGGPPRVVKHTHKAVTRWERSTDRPAGQLIGEGRIALEEVWGHVHET